MIHMCYEKIMCMKLENIHSGCLQIQGNITLMQQLPLHHASTPDAGLSISFSGSAIKVSLQTVYCPASLLQSNALGHILQKQKRSSYFSMLYGICSLIKAVKVIF